jgi:hypothetical protein
MQSKPRKRGEEANGEAGEDVLLGSFLWEEVIQRAQLQRSPEDVSACDVGACVVGGWVVGRVNVRVRTATQAEEPDLFKPDDHAVL